MKKKVYAAGLVLLTAIGVAAGVSGIYAKAEGESELRWNSVEELEERILKARETRDEKLADIQNNYYTYYKDGVFDPTGLEAQ